MHFVDKGATVSVVVPCPSNVTPGAVKVAGAADSLTIMLDGRPEPLLHVVQLYGTVQPQATTCELEANNLAITLQKMDSAQPWPTLEASQEAPVEQEGTGDALAAREKVWPCKGDSYLA